MCGRFSITKEEKQIEERFEASFYTDDLIKRYNAAPSQNLPVIASEEPDKIHLFRWGLIPFWAKDNKIGYKMINARSETILESKVYAPAFKYKRCLVLADGFYEWKKDGKSKTPIRFRRKDDGLFAFAGIYAEWKPKPDEHVHSFSIITTDPNELVEPVHDRMPVILLPEHEKAWLNPGTAQQDLLNMLKPYPSELLEGYVVSTMVNKPGNDFPEIIDPV